MIARRRAKNVFCFPYFSHPGLYFPCHKTLISAISIVTSCPNLSESTRQTVDAKSGLTASSRSIFSMVGRDTPDSRYSSDISVGFPERVTMLTVTDAFGQITIHDKETGRYHLDAEGIAYPVEFLNVFFGSATAPLFPETEEEQRQRRAEEANYILIGEPLSRM